MSTIEPDTWRRWLWGVPCALLALLLALLWGSSLIDDAFWASRGGQDWFGDTASRVAIPVVQAGILLGVVVTSAGHSRSPWKVLRNASFVLWLSALFDWFMYYVDHPLAWIGL